MVIVYLLYNIFSFITLILIAVVAFFMLLDGQRLWIYPKIVSTNATALQL